MCVFFSGLDVDRLIQTVFLTEGSVALLTLCKPPQSLRAMSRLAVVVRIASISVTELELNLAVRLATQEALSLPLRKCLSFWSRLKVNSVRT